MNLRNFKIQVSMSFRYLQRTIGEQALVAKNSLFGLLKPLLVTFFKGSSFILKIIKARTKIFALLVKV